MKNSLFTLVIVLTTGITITAQTGALDISFDPGTGASHRLFSTSIQSDGKIIIGGEFTSYNGTNINRIARLNPDGSLDNNFDVGIGANGFVSSISIQEDGKIIITGQFTSFNTRVVGGIARLLQTGSIEGLSFSRTGVDGTVYCSTIQSDGKILLGGNFTNKIAQLNSNGTIDNTFTFGTFQPPIPGANNSIFSIVAHSNQKILIGGFFTEYNQILTNRIADLNPNGSLNGLFNIGTGCNNSVRAIAVQPDGKIIIAGSFTSYNNITLNRIARLNTDGSLDNSFTIGAGANETIMALAIQSNGKIIIGGDFTTFNGIQRNRIARLNSDGSLDSAFNPGTGANQFIRTLTIQDDGKIIIGGDFTTFNDIPRNRIARLHGDNISSIATNIIENNIAIYPVPASTIITVDISSLESVFSETKITLLDLYGKRVIETTMSDNIVNLNVEYIQSGLYFIMIEHNSNYYLRKLLINH